MSADLDSKKIVEAAFFDIRTGTDVIDRDFCIAAFDDKFDHRLEQSLSCCTGATHRRALSTRAVAQVLGRAPPSAVPFGRLLRAAAQERPRELKVSVAAILVDDDVVARFAAKGMNSRFENQMPIVPGARVKADPGKSAHRI